MQTFILTWFDTLFTIGLLGLLYGLALLVISFLPVKKEDQSSKQY